MVEFAMFEARGATVFSLHRIMIEASHQGEGVGAAAMKLLFDRTSNLGAETIYLGFRPENATAKALFEKLGFVFHIEEPDGEIVYRLGAPKELGT